MEKQHAAPAVQQPKTGRHLKRANGYFYLLPALLLIVVFSYIPFIKTIFLSFFTINSSNEVVAFAGLKNYLRVLEDQEFLNLSLIHI